MKKENKRFSINRNVTGLVEYSTNGTVEGKIIASNDDINTNFSYTQTLGDTDSGITFKDKLSIDGFTQKNMRLASYFFGDEDGSSGTIYLDGSNIDGLSLLSFLNYNSDDGIDDLTVIGGIGFISSNIATSLKYVYNDDDDGTNETYVATLTSVDTMNSITYIHTDTATVSDFYVEYLRTQDYVRPALFTFAPSDIISSFTPNDTDSNIVINYNGMYARLIMESETYDFVGENNDYIYNVSLRGDGSNYFNILKTSENYTILAGYLKNKGDTADKAYRYGGFQTDKQLLVVGIPSDDTENLYINAGFQFGGTPIVNRGATTGLSYGYSEGLTLSGGLETAAGATTVKLGISDFDGKEEDSFSVSIPIPNYVPGGVFGGTGTSALSKTYDFGAGFGKTAACALGTSAASLDTTIAKGWSAAMSYFNDEEITSTVFEYSKGGYIQGEDGPQINTDALWAPTAAKCGNNSYHPTLYFKYEFENNDSTDIETSITTIGYAVGALQMAYATSVGEDDTDEAYFVGFTVPSDTVTIGVSYLVDPEDALEYHAKGQNFSAADISDGIGLELAWSNGFSLTVNSDLDYALSADLGGGVAGFEFVSENDETEVNLGFSF